MSFMRSLLSLLINSGIFLTFVAVVIAFFAFIAGNYTTFVIAILGVVLFYILVKYTSNRFDI